MTELQKQWIISGTSMPFEIWKATQPIYGGLAWYTHHTGYSKDNPKSSMKSSEKAGETK